MLRNLSRSAVIALALGASALGPGAQAQPAAAPASVGVSAQSLSAMDAEFHALVDAGKLAGVTTLVSRHGKVVHRDAYGFQDTAARTPVKDDTIFRIASMTKPVAGVALMILFEEGKWKLDDPVAKYIPEFKDLQVAKVGGGTEPQAHPMTMRELMSHSAGFDVSAAKAYEEAKLRDRDQPLQAMIDKLAKLPLAFQPGTDWRYGPSVEVQGYIVEKLSGQSLDAFLQSRIFAPLKMPDTGFWVDPAKAPRVTKVYTYGEDGKVTLSPTLIDPTAKPVFLSASGGLLSTTGDYWRFCQMLLNGGELDGARILKPETVKLMRQNALQPGVGVDLYAGADPGVGFGLDFAVMLDPALAKSPLGKDSYYWGGAFGTWFWIDPANDLIVVGMIQNVGGSTPGRGSPPVRAISVRHVYAGLDAKK
jgi:CubicO group peptidase (beta-lactamase class C family)